MRFLLTFNSERIYQLSKIAAYYSQRIPWSSCIPNFKVLSIEVNSNLFFCSWNCKYTFKVLHCNTVTCKPQKLKLQISKTGTSFLKTEKSMWTFRWSSRKYQKIFFLTSDRPCGLHDQSFSWRTLIQPTTLSIHFFWIFY